MNRILTKSIDSHPYTGTRYVNGFLKLSEKNYLDHYFDKSVNYDQVVNVTRGKIYQIIKVIGYGDVEDIIFINDMGEEQRLADFFFEELTEEDIKSLEQTCSSEINSNKARVLKMKYTHIR